jgi:hypothetical protein
LRWKIFLTTDYTDGRQDFFEMAFAFFSWSLTTDNWSLCPNGTIRRRELPSFVRARQAIFLSTKVTKYTKGWEFWLVFLHDSSLIWV